MLAVVSGAVFTAGIFVTEDFDDLLAGNNFLDKTIDRTEGALLHGKIPRAAAAEPGSDKHHSKYENQRKQRQPD